MNPIKAVENWLYAHFPAAFATGVSSVLHGLAVLLPALLFGAITPPLGTVVGSVIADRYWIREDGDEVKAKKEKNEYTRREKLRDSMRDRLFPVFALLVANFMLYL